MLEGILDPMDVSLVVQQAARDWPTVPPDSDFNLHDVHHLARRIVVVAGVAIPQAVPDKRTGVVIVEIVEANLFENMFIRDRRLDDLGRRAEQVTIALAHANLLAFEPVVSLSVAFFAWHGCLNMAKTLREKYRSSHSPTGWAPYTPELRRQGYDLITEAWQAADRAGNPWIRYGVSLARSL